VGEGQEVRAVTPLSCGRGAGCEGCYSPLLWRRDVRAVTPLSCGGGM